MAQLVKMPNGNIVEFPDEASQEQIQSAVNELRQEMGQTESLPEFGSLSEFGPTGERAGTGARLGLAFATTPDPESRMDIIREAIPGTEFTTDEQGNTVVELPGGRRAFLNKPGFSPQDFADLASDVVKFVPSARFAAGGRSLLGIGARGFGGGAATSLAEDVAATPQGSRQGLQPGRAAATGVADIAGEAGGRGINFLARRIAPVLRNTFGRRTGDILDEGRLSEPARRSLRRAGIDPDDVTPETAREAIRAIEAGVPEEAVEGIALSRRFGVPLSRAQTTGEFKQFAREEDLAGRTDEAGEIVRQGRRRTAERGAEATTELERQVGGGQPALATEAEGGGRIAGEVQEQAATLDQQVYDAFENLRGKNAVLTERGIDRLGNVAATVRERPDVLVDNELTPATVRALDRIDDFAGRELNSQTLDEIAVTRQRLVALQDAANNSRDRRGVTAVKREYDRFVEDAIENTLFRGDEEALAALQNANKLRAEYGRRFQERTRATRGGRRIQDPGGRAVESIVEKDPTDEQVVNMIFGRSRVFNPENASKTIDALRRATDNSEQVDNTLKQLAFRRISRDAISDGQFRPRRFVTAFNRVMEENPGLMEKIYSKDELKALREFRDIAKRQIAPDGVINTSRTAQTLVRLMGRLGAVFGLQMGGIGMGALGGSSARNIGGFFERRVAGGQARDAINPLFLLTGRPNTALISSSIAAARSEEVQEQARQGAQAGREAVSGQQEGNTARAQ